MSQEKSKSSGKRPEVSSDVTSFEELFFLENGEPLDLDLGDEVISEPSLLASTDDQEPEDDSSIEVLESADDVYGNSELEAETEFEEAAESSSTGGPDDVFEEIDIEIDLEDEDDDGDLTVQMLQGPEKLAIAAGAAAEAPAVARQQEDYPTDGGLQSSLSVDTPPVDTPPVDTQRVGGFDRAPEPKPERVRKVDAIWLVLLLLPVVVASVLYLNSSRSNEVWQARAEIQYRGSAWTETQDVAIQSRSLITPVAEQFDIPVGTFEQNLEAGLVTGTQVVRVDFKSEDPDLAQSVVQAVAANYIIRTSEQTPDGVFETLESERTEVEAEMRAAKTRQAEIPPGLSSKIVADRAAAAAEVDALEQRLTIIEARILDVSLDDLDQNANRVPVLLTEPYVLAEPVGPKPELWGGVGFVVGGLVSAAAAMLAVRILSKRNLTWRGVSR